MNVLQMLGGVGIKWKYKLIKLQVFAIVIVTRLRTSLRLKHLFAGSGVVLRTTTHRTI